MPQVVASATVVVPGYRFLRIERSPSYAASLVFFVTLSSRDSMRAVVVSGLRCLVLLLFL